MKKSTKIKADRMIENIFKRQETKERIKDRKEILEEPKVELIYDSPPAGYEENIDWNELNSKIIEDIENEQKNSKIFIRYLCCDHIVDARAWNSNVFYYGLSQNLILCLCKDCRKSLTKEVLYQSLSNLDLNDNVEDIQNNLENKEGNWKDVPW